MLVFTFVLFILILIPFNYRIFNTLDAMVGYKTYELIDIGFVPAKIDDILNYIPSRIAGLFVVLSAFCLNFDYKNSYKIKFIDLLGNSFHRSLGNKLMQSIK